MLRTLAIAWATPEIRRRIQYVIAMFGVFVVGLHIPVPGINSAAMERLFSQGQIPFLQLLDVFSGGAFRRFTIFAMGITPYINASIIMQLLSAAIPALEEMRKEGEAGQKQIAKYTRYLTAFLALFQALGLTVMLSNFGGATPVFSADLFTRFQVCVSLTAGTCFLLWMGEMITEKGIGQGVSLIIFAGIMARLPYDVGITLRNFSWGGVGGGASVGPLNLLGLLLMFVATVMGIIYVHLGTRRIPIQHAKKVVGNRVVQAQSSYLPFKVNVGGVIPIIFAISLMMFPATIVTWLRNPNTQSFWTQAAEWIQRYTTPGAHWVPSLLYALLIFVFTYFYAAIVINIPELTENLKKYGSYVPGYRPGRPTQDYLDRVMTRITFAGAMFLAVVGLLQYYTGGITGVHTFSLVGGTSLLIVVGVALDTMQNLESHLVMRNYGGFIKAQAGGRRHGAAASLGSMRLS
ncbi:MAG: preprotein translocase subunit SecY [Armatimonadetes bacterium]|nr:preprotein translocase subunit SecY [Armatimonadota bacterium]